MPYASVLPSPVVAWDREWWWPVLQMARPGTTDGQLDGTARWANAWPNGLQTAFQSANNTNVYAPFWRGFGVAGAPGNDTIRIQDGVVHGTWSPGAGSFGAIATEPVFEAPLTIASMAAGFGMPSLSRVFRVRAYWRWDGVGGTPPDDGAGVAMVCIGNAGGTSWPNQAANQLGAMGFFGDGAGGVRYRSFEQAPAYPGNLLETVALPAWTVGEWHTVEFQMISAAPGREGSFLAIFDGSEIVSRSFASGLLPVYGVEPGGTPTYHFRFQFRAAQQATQRLGGVHVQQGRFTRAGLELNE